MIDYADNNLEDMIKVGVINEIDLKNTLYRVKFEQDNNVKSNWFQPLFPSTNKNKTYFQYSLGEQVLVLMPYEGNQEGFIVASMYSEKDKPPRVTEGLQYIQFENGDYIQYDKTNKSLTVNAPEFELCLNVKSLKIQAKEIETVGESLQNSSKNISIMCDDYVVNADSTMVTGDTISLIANNDIIQNSNKQVMQYDDYGILANTTDICSNTGINLNAKTNINAIAPTSFAITSPSTTASGTLGVTGATTVGGTLGVTGATTLSNTLGVTGNTTLSGTLGVTKATTLSDTLQVTKETTLNNTLSVSGLSTLSGDAKISNLVFTSHAHWFTDSGATVQTSTPVAHA